MRDPNRLYGFYAELGRIHMKYFPDWRFGQFISNFNSWIYNHKDIDIFFPEEDKMLAYIKEFVGEK